VDAADATDRVDLTLELRFRSCEAIAELSACCRLGASAIAATTRWMAGSAFSADPLAFE
jgi:hypothetical protein